MKFAMEKWTEILPELQKLFPLHWEELAVDRETIKLSPDYEKYAAMEKAGMLVLFTVRHEKELVGYFTAVLVGHFHYKDAGLMAQTDMYFVLPKYRVGGTGAKLLAFVENRLRNAGISKMYISTKVHMDQTALLEKLGWRFTDRMFTKLLKA